MKVYNNPGGFLTALFTVLAIFLCAVLYESGFISEDIYLKLISAAKPEIVEFSDVEVHFIDVGQSECILIKAPEKNVLIDSGDVGCGKKIKNYLRTNGVYSVDLFITTHPHSDHIGSAEEILRAFPVGEAVIPEVPEEYLPSTFLFEDFLNAIGKKDCRLSFAKTKTVYDLGGGAELIIIGNGDYCGDNLNNYSVVSKLTFGEVSFLFTGDAEEEIELSLVSSGADLSCTVLSAGHHGSSTSNSAVFVKAADPKYAAISCGLDNDYGHPHKETTTLFRELEIEIYRTDYDGDIVFGTNGSEISVATRK